ncbi:MAG: hypothetical protein NVSMB9_07140 [Isosphaeraceae bacterium]
MKILVISNLYPPDTIGGYELGCSQVVEALGARGHEVRVLTSAPRSPLNAQPHVIRTLKLSDLWDYYTESHSAQVTLRLRETEAFQVSAFNVHGLLTVLEDFEPDVVYAWMLVGVGGLGLMACLQHLRIPWVWHLMDEVPSKLCTVHYQVPPPLAREFARQIRGTFLACSQQLIDEIARSGIDLGDRVEILPNWIHGPLPTPRTTFYRGGGLLRIAAAAAVIDRNYDKGIDLLIEAAASLRDEGFSEFRLDVFGKVTDHHYADLIRSHELSEQVRLLGPCSHKKLTSTFEDYDVFAFPGRTSEPFGFAPLEALGRGCVPVVNRRAGNSEWLVHGVHCLKVTRRAESFASQFRQILDGKIPLEPIARRGQHAVGRDFHLNTLAPAIERALLDAAGRSRSGAGSPEDVYRLAILAEKLCGLLIQEAHCA